MELNLKWIDRCDGSLVIIHNWCIQKLTSCTELHTIRIFGRAQHLWQQYGNVACGSGTSLKIKNVQHRDSLAQSLVASASVLAMDRAFIDEPNIFPNQYKHD